MVASELDGVIHWGGTRALAERVNDLTGVRTAARDSICSPVLLPRQSS